MVIYALGLLWLSQVRPGSYAQSILPGVILWGWRSASS
jgi:hypothetical protein